MKIDTPNNIDKIFSLECFKFNEMKGLFHLIFDYLTKMSYTINDLNKKVEAIPDFSKMQMDITKLFNMMEKLKYKHEQLEIKVEDNEKENKENFDNIDNELDINK